jgi:RNA polymerase subunit RPABC4/transcription elongation factor Spt4
MITCQNCGNVLTNESNFCRYCGTKFLIPQVEPGQDYDFAPPRPYVWKTDEFQTQTEPRQRPVVTQDARSMLPSEAQNFSRPLAYQQPYSPVQPFHCRNCGSTYLPRIERRISTAGWVTFAVLLVVFFPLFWIGLLIKEDVRVCQVCNSRAV